MHLSNFKTISVFLMPSEVRARWARVGGLKDRNREVGDGGCSEGRIWTWRRGREGLVENVASRMCGL